MPRASSRSEGGGKEEQVDTNEERADDDDKKNKNNNNNNKKMKKINEGETEEIGNGEREKLNGEVEANMDTMLDEVDDVAAVKEGAPSIGDGALAFTPPRLLLVPLLPFQAEFVVWAQGQEQNETVCGGVLADEMGMGKVCDFVRSPTHSHALQHR